MSSILQAFQDILQSNGLAPAEIITDGKLHRCPTGASIHLASEYTVYVAFSAQNLPVVTDMVRRQFPDKPLLICGDNDETGRSKAQEAAQAVHGRLVIPTFTTGTDTDFNDLHQSEGLPEVRRQLEAAEYVEAHARGHNIPSLVSLDMGTLTAVAIVLDHFKQTSSTSLDRHIAKIRRWLDLCIQDIHRKQPSASLTP